MLLSIIIPCYNEGEKLIKNIHAIKEYMQNLNIKYEIICINDGSNDNTKEEMKKNHFENVKFVGYSKNKGKGYAVKTGIKLAVGDRILFMDADLSTDLTAIQEALKIDEDIVIGSRTHPNSKVEGKTILRNISSYISNLIIRILTGMKLKDTQCGFKMFKKNIAKFIISKQNINRWAFDVEYLYIAYVNGINIKEIPVKWSNDRDSRVNIIKDSISFIKETIKIIKNKKNYV